MRLAAGPALLLVAAAGPALAQGSLDGLADRLAEATVCGTAGPPRDVGLLVQGPAPIARALVERLAVRLARRGCRSTTELPDDDLVAARRRGVDLRWRLALRLGDETLEVEGGLDDLDGWPWVDGRPVRELQLSRLLDGELRRLLPPAPTPPRLAAAIESRPLPLPSPELELLALDVGDLDGDGAAELVGATVDEVVAWRLDPAAGRLAELRRWRLDGPAAPTRPRLEVVTVAIEGGAVLAHASRFSQGVRLRLGSDEEGPRFPGFPLPRLDATCPLEEGVAWLRGEGCVPPLRLPNKTWSAAGLRGHPGTLATIASDGVLRVEWPAGEPQSAPGAGAQVTLARLPRGLVVATSTSALGGADALLVRALAPSLPLVVRFDRLPGVVTALAAGDLDHDGRDEIVAAVRDRGGGRTELLLLR